MSKAKRVLVVLLLVLTAAMSFVAMGCGKRTIQVQFYGESGPAMLYLTAYEGQIISRGNPELSEIESRPNFLGWYSDPQYLVPYDFTKPVYGDMLGAMNLYGKFNNSLITGN